MQTGTLLDTHPVDGGQISSYLTGLVRFGITIQPVDKQIKKPKIICFVMGALYIIFYKNKEAYGIANNK